LSFFHAFAPASTGCERHRGDRDHPARAQYGPWGHRHPRRPPAGERLHRRDLPTIERREERADLWLQRADHEGGTGATSPGVHTHESLKADRPLFLQRLCEFEQWPARTALKHFGTHTFSTLAHFSRHHPYHP